MPCYKPIEAWYSKEVNSSGKRSLVFNEKAAYSSRSMQIPCGQCIGCRLERSRQWAMRCVHESSLHESNCFITLTYDDEHLPANGSLVKKHHKDFIKRLRKHCYPKKIKFYLCGEYGDRNGRPHYHAIIFNHDFFDKSLISVSGDSRLYNSPQLTKLWGHGLTSVGDVTFESAAYVARYILKKVTGEQADEHYKSVDSETGELSVIEPEYTSMSNRGGGIGRAWYEKYKHDLDKGFITMRGVKMRPPRFYDKLIEQDNSYFMDFLKFEREKEADSHVDDNTRERLDVREKVKKSQINQLKRNL